MEIHYSKDSISSIQGAVPVTVYKPEEDSFARASHDFCNKTTWYTNSVRVEGETATLLTSTTYSLANTFIIDVVNGITNRQDLMQAYAVIVKEDGAVISGYTLNHNTGVITFDSAPSGTITVDYSYATDSEWIIEPSAGKTLIIEHSEVQFCNDIIMDSPIRFEVWGYNPYFGVPGHPLESMLRIEYQSVQYNSIKDVINESNLGTGIIPQVGDLPGDIHVFPFNYVTIKPFKSSMGMQLRLRTVGNKEITGSYGTASFYLVSRNE